MTTLVGVQGNGWCVLGSDSRASLESGKLIDAATPKIVNKDRKSTRLNSSHVSESRMPSSA